MGLKRLGGVAGLTLLSCGSEATRPQPEVPVVRSAESVSAPEAPPVDPCGPAEAGPTVEDARKSWELGLELLSEGKVDAARCPFERATRTLERVTGAKAEQVTWGPGRPVIERGGLVFYGVETLARAASGDLAFGQALFGVQRVEGGELEPRLSLVAGDDVLSWAGTAGGFAVAGKPSRVFRAATDWTDLSTGTGIALDPTGRLALVCNQGTLKGYDVSIATAPELFSRASGARCRFGRFAAQGRLYAEEEGALILETSTGNPVAPADLDAETLATLGVKTGVVQKRPKLAPPSIAPTFEQLSKPFKARLEKSKRVIVPPSPHDVSYDTQGAKLAVLTTGEITSETWAPFVRDIVVHVVDPSASKVLRSVALPSSQSSRVSVSLGPKGRALVVCAQSVGGFLVDVKTGILATLEGMGSDFACDFGTHVFSDDGERVMTRAGLVEVGRLAPGPASAPAFVERLRVGTYELLERAKSQGSFAEAEAEGVVRCRFGPILTPGEVCAARFR